MTPFTRRLFCSWNDARWRSVLIREFQDEAEVDEMRLPPVPDQHVVLVTAGDTWMESHGARGWRGSRYVPGQIGLTAPGRPTRLRWRITAPNRTVHLHVPGRVTARAAAELWDRDLPQPDALAVTDPLLEQVMRSLLAAARSGLDDLYAEAAAEFLAVHLLTRHGGRPVPPLSRREDARVRRAIAFMHERFDQPLTLADIAGAAWLSVYHFIRVFKAATGTTPRQYLTRLRIEQAGRLLDRTDLTVGEIAMRCGFRSPAHLSAAFLRETGLRPSAYRRRRS